MKALHFSVAYRTRGTRQAPAQAHVRYITRAQAGAAEHVDYVTRTARQTREDLVASGYGNLPAWARNDPAAFFVESDRWERANGRTATQITAMLPRALNREQLVGTTQAFIQSQLGTSHAYVWGIHETVASDGGRYPHAHIAFSERRDTGRAQTPHEYFTPQVNPKERVFSQRQWPFAARQAWSDTLNVTLEAAGAPDRVSARSFRDQGIDWQAAQYIDRQTLQRDKARLHQRERTEDTPEALVKRTQEWEARKRQLGLTQEMSHAEIVQRIGEASRTRLRSEREMPARVLHPDLSPANNVQQGQSGGMQDRPPRPTRYEGPVIGNRRSMIYHEPTQKNYRDVHPNNQEHFRTAHEAEMAGYRRARNDLYSGTSEHRLEHIRQLQRQEVYYTQHPEVLRPPAHLAAIAKVLQDDEHASGRRRMRPRWNREEEEQTRGMGRTW